MGTASLFLGYLHKIKARIFTPKKYLVGEQVHRRVKVVFIAKGATTWW